MAFRDAELAVIEYLRGSLTGVTVLSKVPKVVPAKFVRVWRTGGPVSGRVVDRPQLSVQAWGAEALDLAEQVRVLLIDGAKRSTAGFSRVSVESLYYDPDPTSGVDRYSLLVFLTVRASR